MTLIDSTVTGNTAFTFGGGIYNVSIGTVTLIDSTVTGNTVAVAGGRGGGILNECGGTLVGAVAGGNVFNNTPDNIANGLFGC